MTTAILAQLAAGSVPTSIRLGFAMLGLQVSIGALNDLVDAPRDAATKPGKPIPRGAASVATARAIAVGGLLVAVILLLPSGLPALAVLAACAACGYGYDLWLSRTAWSWLPLAVALPLVPVFAWVGAVGGLPAAVAVLVPAGMLGGAGLALANGLADLERDRSTGAATAAVRLGRERAWLAHAGLLLVAVAIPIAAAVGGSVPGAPALSADRPGWVVAFLGIAGVAAGIVLGRSGGAGRRERAWELEAIGVALVAGGWLAAVAGG